MRKWGFDYLVVTLLLFAAALFYAVNTGRRTGNRSVYDLVAWFALFAAVLFVAHLLESLRFWWRRRRNREKSQSLLVILLVAAAVPAVAATPLPATVGVGYEGRVEFTGLPYASGAWGTDYLTSGHAIRATVGYQITTDGRHFEKASLVVACSGIVHGIDAMLLRVAIHQRRPTVGWGDPADLKPGDELRIVPYGLPPLNVRLLHHVFEEWADRGTDDWPAETNRVFVAEADRRHAPTLAGYSGAPWVRNGRGYGLHKGSAKVKDDKIVALAEPVTRIKECFDRTGYSP